MRYNFNQQYQPPAPFVHLTVVNSKTGGRAADVPAQIDTGADRTVLPCIAHGIGKRGLTLSEPLKQRTTDKLGRGSDPFFQTRAQYRLPSFLADQLELVQLDNILVVGFSGTHIRTPTYMVEIGIRDSQTVSVEAFGSPNEPFVLLGRDILNHYHIVFDGPRSICDLQFGS